MKKAKVLLFDLETTPLLSYNWGTYDQNAIAVKKDWQLLSVGYKWLGEKKTHCITRQDQKSDKALTKKLHKLLSQADIVIAHNGDQFDVKKSNAKFLEHDLGPPRPTKSIDTLKIARRRFKLTSNKLNELGKLLGVGEKVKTGGFDLWLDCMKDVPKAWRQMVKYNKQDVQLLEKVYLKLRPWDKSHPNMTAKQTLECTKCNGRLISRGYGSNSTSTYTRFQCRACQSWCRGAIVERTRKSVVNE